MNDEQMLDPLDILIAYGTARQFIEARLNRLKAAKTKDQEGIGYCEGMSDVLMRGIVLATSALEPDVQVEVETDSPTLMLS